MPRFRLVFALPLCLFLARAQEPRVRVWEETLTLPTYREGPPDPEPPFDQLGARGADMQSIYPYTYRDNRTAERYFAKWRALYIENAYLKCAILPDLGGHLYSCRDKIAGVDVFYANTAVKKTDAAPRSSWVAMGIETSFPVAHSRLTVSPIHFATETNADGSGIVFVGATDRVSGMGWRVGYTLRPASAVLEQRVWLWNPGPVRQVYQWWTNAAVRLPASGNLQLTYPMYVTAPHGAGVLSPWPLSPSGIDFSRTINYPDSIGLFAFGSREPFFAAYNPESQNGVAHWADPAAVPGKKVWVWGNRPTEDYRTLLSDDHSGYTEIQAGLLTTQDLFEFLGPQQSRSFTEFWIPARRMGGITRATPDAVLFLKRSPQAGGNVTFAIDLCVTRSLAGAVLSLSKGSQSVFRQTVDLDPAATSHHETPAVDAAGKYRFELTDSSGHVLLAHQEDTYDALKPSEVKLGVPLAKALPAAAVEHSRDRQIVAEAETEETNRHLDRALALYTSGLKTMPNSAPLRKAAARLYLTLGRFSDAAALLSDLASADPEAAFDLGVAKSRLGDDRAALPLWESVPKDSPLSAAARYETACASARLGSLEAALPLFHAIAAAGPGPAAGLEVALLRRLRRSAEAEAAVDRYLAADPADPLLQSESVFLGRDGAALWSHLGADPEWVLDLVDDYLGIGSYEDALSLLARNYPTAPELQAEPGAVPPQQYPLIGYYRGYVRRLLKQSPVEDFRLASSQSTHSVFPSRASSFPVLRAAVEQDPSDLTAHYLLGCLYLNSRMTDEALAEWKIASPAADRIPAYYKTVARIMSTVKNDSQGAQTLLQQAIAEHPSDASLVRLLKRMRGVPDVKPVVAPAAAPPPPATPAIVASPSAGGAKKSAPAAGPPIVAVGPVSATEQAAYALALASAGRSIEAAAVFRARNFPDEKQPVEVRQAYVETQLQLLLSKAKAGECTNVDALVGDFGTEVSSLPFTFSGILPLTRTPRIQFYLGLVEDVCGQSKAAIRRWTRVAKQKELVTSPDYAFPWMAAARIDPTSAARSIETALETVRMSGNAVENSLRLYSEGQLLRASGRADDASQKFLEGARAGSDFMRYLNTVALFDPTPVAR